MAAVLMVSIVPEVARIWMQILKGWRWGVADFRLTIGYVFAGIEKLEIMGLGFASKATSTIVHFDE